MVVPARAGHGMLGLLHDVLSIPRPEALGFKRQACNLARVAVVGKANLTLKLVVQPELFGSQFFGLGLARDRGINFQLLVGFALGIVVLDVGDTLNGLAVRPNIGHPAGRILRSGLAERVAPLDIAFVVFGDSPCRIFSLVFFLVRRITSLPSVHFSDKPASWHNCDRKSMSEQRYCSTRLYSGSFFARNWDFIPFFFAISLAMPG